MRIDSTSISLPNMTQQSMEGQTAQPTPQIPAETIMLYESQSETTYVIKSDKDKLQQAIDTMNEFFEINNSAMKFVFHEELEKYYVQLVNTDTDEVIREIPSKKMLDVFYEMQKLAGIIVDEKI